MKISVAICTYNGERYIAEQIDSILSQSVPVQEIVVCDDCSTDKTPQILKKYEADFPGIFKIYSNDKNLKVIKNFEKAINLCSGDIIFLSDQDDIWVKNKVVKVLNFFRDNPDCDAVFHDMQLFEKQPLSQTLWGYLSFKPSYLKKLELFDYLIFIENIVAGSALAIRKTKSVIFDDLPKKFLHDYQLAISYAYNSKIKILPEILGYYRIHQQQQVGAQLESSVWLERINNLVLNPGKTTERLDYLISRKEIWETTGFSFFEKNIILERLENLIGESRKEFLKNYSFLTRKKILLSWFFRNKYSTNLRNLLFD